MELIGLPVVFYKPHFPALCDRLASGIIELCLAVPSLHAPIVFTIAKLHYLLLLFGATGWAWPGRITPLIHLYYILVVQAGWALNEGNCLLTTLQLKIENRPVDDTFLSQEGTVLENPLVWTYLNLLLGLVSLIRVAFLLSRPSVPQKYKTI